MGCFGTRDSGLGTRKEQQQWHTALLLLFPSPESRVPSPVHVQPITNSGWSNSTGWPLSVRILRTVPETSASIGLNIFLASMMPRVSPALTDWPTVTNGGLSGAGEA